MVKRGCRYIAARFISAYKRSLCFICIGGDEFCVIMRKDLDKIKMLNCRFQETLEQLHENNIKLSGVSLGYTYYDEKKTDIQDVIAQADEMMYNKKCGNISN